MTDAEQAALDEYRGEVAAFATQRLLGNKAFMKKLITTDPSTAEKLIGKIRELYENFKVRKDPAAKAQLEIVRKAEKLFMQGLSEAGGTIDSKGKIHLANREEDEELTRENSEKMQVRRLASPKSVDNYTEEEYNNFGWVRANDVLNKGEWKDFTSKFAAAVSKQTAPPKTKSGEYMIAVSDIDDTLRYGTDNFIVFAKGSIESPQVSRVLEIDLDNGTQIDEHRRNVYALERRGIQPKIGGIFHLYSATDSRYLRNGQDYNTQSSGYNDQLGTDREAGGRGAVEAERGQVSASVKPVSQTFTDITGKKGVVLGAGEGRYMVDGSIKNRDFIFDSPEAAIEAENKAIVESLARRHQRTPTWVRARLNEDPHYFSKKIQHSRKATGDTVTISKGEMAKLHANYAGEKVFDKKSVKDALASVEAFQKLPSKLRTEFVNRIWAGYNQRLHQQGFEQFTEVMWHQLHATIMQEVGYDELGTMTEDQYAEEF